MIIDYFVIHTSSLIYFTILLLKFQSLHVTSRGDMCLYVPKPWEFKNAIVPLRSVPFDFNLRGMQPLHHTEVNTETAMWSLDQKHLRERAAGIQAELGCWWLMCEHCMCVCVRLILTSVYLQYPQACIKAPCSYRQRLSVNRLSASDISIEIFRYLCHVPRLYSH